MLLFTTVTLLNPVQIVVCLPSESFIAFYLVEFPLGICTVYCSSLNSTLFFQSISPAILDILNCNCFLKLTITLIRSVSSANLVSILLSSRLVKTLNRSNLKDCSEASFHFDNFPKYDFPTSFAETEQSGKLRIDKEMHSSTVKCEVTNLSSPS